MDYRPKIIQLQANGIAFSALACGEGPLVLCLHGFPDSARTWSGLLPALAATGYRAVAPFMRGYAPTEVPADGRYDPGSLAADVFALADALGAQRFFVVGHDWGAVAAYAAATNRSERLLGIVTAAVPPLPRFLSNMRGAQLRRSWYMLFFQLPGIAEKRLARNDFALVERLWRDWSPDWDFTAADIAPVKQALATPAARTAALGYYRALLPTLLNPHRARPLLGTKTTTPALIMAGTRDGCIGTEMFTGSENGFTGACDTLHLDAGHFMHRELPGEFNAHVLHFLDHHRPPGDSAADPLPGEHA